MADLSKIEWCDATWNPIVDCSIVSPGCTNCYAQKMAARLERMGSAVYSGLTQSSKAGPVWTGKLALQESVLTAPLRWKRPRKIFVNSMSDLFHEDAPDEWIDRVFAVMALAPQHVYQVLTKRSARMRQWASDQDTPFRVAREMDRISVRIEIGAMNEETVKPIENFPGYFVSDWGHIYTSHGSETCVRCGASIPEDGIASRRFCGKKCRDMESYDKRVGKGVECPETRRRMAPMPIWRRRGRRWRESETNPRLMMQAGLPAWPALSSPSREREMANPRRRLEKSLNDLMWCA